MKCQECCPINKGKLKYETLPQVFNLEETRAILDANQPRQGSVWDSIRAKLASADLVGLGDVLGRNLRALIEARRAS